MADYTALGSETRVIQNRIDALAGSTLSAVELLYLSEAITLLGTSLGVNDIVGATNSAISKVSAAGASTITVIGGTANGSAVSTLSTQVSSTYTLLNNLTPRIQSLESISSSITSAAASASAQAQQATLNPWTIVTASRLAVTKDRYFVVPVSGLIITLPASPNTGDEVSIVDAAGTAATTNFTIARNGSLIQGSASDLVFNVNSKSIRLVYSNSTYGWRLV
jgi:hypothetical protein